MGDVRNLARLFNRALRELKVDSQCDIGSLRSAIVELLACFPVYRTYLTAKSLYDTSPFRAAIENARQINSALSKEFSAIDYLLKESQSSPRALHALMRLQQFTGAVMAKGFEDTALYRYNRLLSLNDVGSSPDQFGVSLEEFHKRNILRQQNWPQTLNASSTHDTKRGEDVRARLNVISELPNEFKINVEKWAKINSPKKKQVRGKLAPDRNEEYYLYQTLLGALPLDPKEQEDFATRLQLHMVKALREAKTNTNWLTPNLPYEQTVTDFVTEILRSKVFFEAFLPFQRKIAFFGFFNSLSQTLLKITCPGSPDFYQGAELWDLNLVDPDNRRSVDFETRQKMLLEILSQKKITASSLLENKVEGKAKLYVIYRALQTRRKLKALFEEGDYIPLAVEGKYGENVVAFCRKKGACNVIVVVPRFLTSLMQVGDVWSSVNWADTSIILPKDSPTSWTDAFTAQTVRSKNGQFLIRDILGEFPVAMLFSGD